MPEKSWLIVGLATITLASTPNSQKDTAETSTNQFEKLEVATNISNQYHE